MTTTTQQNSQPVVVTRADFPRLFDTLRAAGFEIVAPTVREGAIVLDVITDPDQLPVGWTDHQDGATYRLQRRDDEALFGYNAGPHSWKSHLFPSALTLWRAGRKDGGFTVEPNHAVMAPTAFVGVRACDVAAIKIQDRIFIDGPYPDPVYAERRRGVFIVAVNCTTAGGTCFCASMGTGPQAQEGFDLALTELISADGHAFLMTAGSDRGIEILASVPHQPASPAQIDQAQRRVAEAALHMGRRLDTTDVKDVLYRSVNHPRWDHVAARCLTCANCTMVCPTCFCTTVEDTTDLTGKQAERRRRWDSCFTLDFSYIHGGVIRSSARARYRQWLTHKLAAWHDQFGSSGCVGCGRCITWCPVGIDITEEAAAIRAGTGESRPVTAAKESTDGKP